MVQMSKDITATKSAKHTRYAAMIQRGPSKKTYLSQCMSGSLAQCRLSAV